MVHELTDYLSRALITSHNKTDALRVYVLLVAAIYLIDSTVKKSDFELTASALKCAALDCSVENLLGFILILIIFCVCEIFPT